MKNVIHSAHTVLIASLHRHQRGTVEKALISGIVLGGIFVSPTIIKEATENVSGKVATRLVQEGTGGVAGARLDAADGQ